MNGRRRLGVNVDHVATIRQARRGFEPDPVAAALLSQEAGADGITIHLREDRRHIQDADLPRLKAAVSLPINLEMAATVEMVRIACDFKPNAATLVPEKREEITTEGGLDVVANFDAIRDAVSRLSDAGIIVSLFIDPVSAQVEATKRAGAHAFEIHTGTFCHAFASRDGHEDELVRVADAACLGLSMGLRVLAGHGLDTRNIASVLTIHGIEEFNIGHSIVARAVFVGLAEAVREIADPIHATPLFPK